MTIQTQHFIDLSDIVTLRCECKKCGATLLVSIDNREDGYFSLTSRGNDVLNACPNCRNPWADLGQGPAFNVEIKKAIESLNRLKEIQQYLGCSMRFEIKSTAVPKTDKA